MAIRFKEDDVRPMGLVAAGVNGIKLDDKDEVVGVEILPAEGEIFLLTSDGKAKRVDEKEFPTQGRYGKGVSPGTCRRRSRLRRLPPANRITSPPSTPAKARRNPRGWTGRYPQTRRAQG